MPDINLGGNDQNTTTLDQHQLPVELPTRAEIERWLTVLVAMIEEPGFELRSTADFAARAGVPVAQAPRALRWVVGTIDRLEWLALPRPEALASRPARRRLRQQARTAGGERRAGP